MFLLTRPSDNVIDEFLRDNRNLELSYRPVGAARSSSQIVETALIGHGRADFERARQALINWKQFDLGWVTLFPRQASIDAGTNVAVLITHLGFWSLNGCRVVYQSQNTDTHFGYAYGTLTTHAESGEELFEVSIDESTNAVTYRIQVVAAPQHWLARLGTPYVRMLQARFRRDSIAAMRRAVSSSEPSGQRRNDDHDQDQSAQ